MRSEGATPKTLALRLCLCIAATVATSGALAALSDQHAAFGSGPARFIMTPEELAAWKTVKDDLGATEFIERFWARRDAAYHVLFDQAVAYADQKFVSRRTKRGSLSDMGKVLVIMGQPTRQHAYDVYKDSPSGVPQNPYIRDVDRRRWG